MRTQAIGLVLLGALFGTASARQGDADGAPAVSPWPQHMVVARDGVNLRAGPSVAYEVVARLARGSTVEVVGQVYDWYRVTPSEPVPVYVAASLIECKEGGVGIVRRDRVNVRARPSLQASVLGQLAAGDPVRVLEAGAKWVRIEAPPGLHFYLHEKLLAPAGSVAVAPAEQPDPQGRSEAQSEQHGKPESVAQLVARALQLYEAELRRDRIADMSFEPSKALFTEALEREDAPAAVRAAARRGLARIELLERMRADYERRRREIERALASDPAGESAERPAGE